MTAVVHRRIELACIDSQAKAKSINAAFTAKSHLDWLADQGVDHIVLADGRRIDVMGNPYGLEAAIEGARFTQ